MFQSFVLLVYCAVPVTSLHLLVKAGSTTAVKLDCRVSFCLTSVGLQEGSALRRHWYA